MRQPFKLAYDKKTTLPKSANGYQFAGIHCGIKNKGQKDLALIYSEVPAKAVACFTKNQVQAAPIHQGRQALQSGPLQAIIINSGIANVVTGKRGLEDAQKIAQKTQKTLGFTKSQVLMSSTGKVGGPLPRTKILNALPQLVEELASSNLKHVAQAIMTTDRFIKVHQVKVKVGSQSYHITGIAKGAGMIEPHMATMLAYILTDLDAPLPYLRRVFKKAVDASFNRISVDGDCSTNDTALLMANGLAKIKLSAQNKKACNQFEKALDEVCQALAYRMVQDGEGATKVVELEISGARSNQAAQKIAYSIAQSQLVKTSFFGEDPNWGRVAVAMGYAGEKLDLNKVSIYYGNTCLLKNGSPTPFKNEKKASQTMKDFYFKIKVELGLGTGSASVLTSDLGYEYVRINAEYRT